MAGKIQFVMIAFIILGTLTFTVAAGVAVGGSVVNPTLDWTVIGAAIFTSVSTLGAMICSAF